MSLPAPEIPRDSFEHPLSRLSAGRRRRPVRHPIDLVSALGASVVVSNIIMQLANPKVGWGVHESRVDSGSAFVHPVKRARTTGTFLVEWVRRARLHDPKDGEVAALAHASACEISLASWAPTASGSTSSSVLARRTR